MNKIVIGLGLLLIVFLVGCGQSQVQTSETSRADASGDQSGGVSGNDFIRYEKGKYDQSVADGKVVLLDFSANWCPTCRIEDPKIAAAVSELNNPNLVAYLVHFNDDETNDEDKAIARDFGVTYQYTKVIVKDGEQVLKSLEPWNKERALSELNRFV